MVFTLVRKAKEEDQAFAAMKMDRPNPVRFWTLIGVDQALHHLTGFGLSIFMAANG